MTTQRQIRKAFWDMERSGYFKIQRKRITSYDGKSKMHNTDTRCAFVAFVDYLSKSGEISEALAQRVTLD